MSTIQDAAGYFQVPDRLLGSIIMAESAGNPRAVSSAGAQGLGQLMPETAKGLGVSDPFDERQNVGGAALYLKQLLAHFHGNPVHAVAAYNAGPGTIDAYLAGRGSLPEETRAYVQRVIGMFEGTA